MESVNSNLTTTTELPESAKPANSPKVTITSDEGDPVGWKALALQVAGTATAVLGILCIGYAFSAFIVGGPILTIAAEMTTATAAGVILIYLAYEMFRTAESKDPDIHPGYFLDKAISRFQL